MATQHAVRFANHADMSKICDIVNHYIAGTTINFRTNPQEPSDWLADFEQYRHKYPWLVALGDDGSVAGFAYAAPWKARAAYDWSAEVTVYVSSGNHRRKIGSALYAQLLAILDDQGYHTEVAVIALPNINSVSLHERFGFEHVGTLREIGNKFGEWRDVGFWQRRNQSGLAKSSRPLELAELATIPGRVV